MEPHQERVVVEKAELDDKIKKLEAFSFGDIFQSLSSEERGRLTKQLIIMRSYSAVLGDRIAAF